MNMTNQTPPAWSTKATLEQDSDGWWAYYKTGWKSFTDPVGAQHQDQADTISEIKSLIKNSIPCNCDDCKRK